MPARLFGPFLPPPIPDPERAHRVTILHVALAVAAAGSVLIAVLNWTQGATAFAIFLLVTAAVYLVALAVSHLGHPTLAAVLLSSMIFLAILFTLVDGAGLSDPAIVALPLFILATTYFFGAAAILVSSALSIGMVVSLYLLHHARLIVLSNEPSLGRLAVLVILLASTGTLVAVLHMTWRRTLAALRRSEQRLELAIDAAGLAMWDWDIPGQRLSVNRTWLDSLGYPPDYHPSPDDWLERIHPEDRVWVQESLQAHLRGETASWSPQYRCVTVQGGSIWLQCLGRVMERETSGEARRVIGVHLDITERKEADQALRASEDRYHRLSRELHDSVAQTLYSMMLTLRAARLMVERGAGSVGGLLAQLDSLAETALDEMRTLLRQGRPEALERQGLAAALREHFQGLRERGALDVQLEVTGEADLAVEAELTLYRIAQEALSNVVKHARVAHAEVRLTLTPETATLVVEDDGPGFDLAGSSGGDGGFGLTNMRERAEAAGGRFEIVSRRGGGTRVRAEIPVARPEPIGA